MKVKLLIAFIFVLIVGGLGGSEYAKYQRDTEIGADPGSTVGVITGAKVTKKTRLGMTTRKYSIDYHYLVDGKTYDGNVSLTNDSGEAAISRGTFDLVYSKSQPSVHALKAGYRGGRTASQLMWSMAKLLLVGLVMAPLAGWLLAAKFGWLKKKQAAPKTVPQEV